MVVFDIGYTGLTGVLAAGGAEVQTADDSAWYTGAVGWTGLFSTGVLVGLTGT